MRSKRRNSGYARTYRHCQRNCFLAGLAPPPVGERSQADGGDLRIRRARRKARSEEGNDTWSGPGKLIIRKEERIDVATCASARRRRAFHLDVEERRTPAVRLLRATTQLMIVPSTSAHFINMKTFTSRSVCGVYIDYERKTDYADHHTEVSSNGAHLWLTLCSRLPAPMDGFRRKKKNVTRLSRRVSRLQNYTLC